MNATTTTTTAVPAGVDLTAERHDELVQTMVVGRAADATATEVRAGLLAGNALLTAYWSLIVRRARAGLHGAAADDRAGEAGVRAVTAVRSYDPTRGATLLTWLQTQRVWSGEAVATAAMPIGVPSSREERREGWRSGNRDSVLSLDLDPELGETADAAAGTEAIELAQDLATAMTVLGSREREWLAAAYGLGGTVPVRAGDIALAAGVTERAVRRSLAASRDSLRQQAPWLAFAA